MTAPQPFMLRCPDGRPPTDGEVAACARRISEVPDIQSEPYVAVDPLDPRRMAVAIQTRTVETAGIGAQTFPVRAYTSSDAGESWQAAAAVPLEDTPDQVRHADPLVAFGPDGALYQAGLSVGLHASTTPLGGGDIFLARSLDLGASWERVVRVTQDGDNDRQWIGVGPAGQLVMTWQTVSGQLDSQAAWSLDGGATWTQAADVPDCTYVSSPVVDPSGFAFACSAVGEAGGCVTRLYRVAYDEGKPVLAGCPAPDRCSGTNLLSRGRDRLLLACLLGDSIYESLDGGTTWASIGAVEERAGEAADGRFVYWMAADPGGGVHLLLKDFAFPAGPSRGVAHAVLVPEQGWRLAEWHELTSPSQTKLSAEGGEFPGMAFWAVGGLVAWVHHDHQVRVAWLAPGP